MNLYSLTQLLLIVGLPLAPTGTGGSILHDALARWQAFDQDVDYQDLLSCAKVVRENATRGDAETFDRLTSIVQTRTHPLVSRLQALEVACEIADEEAARQLLQMMNATLQELREGQKAGQVFGDREGAPVKILATFIRRGVAHVTDVMSEQTELLGFLELCYFQRGVHPKAMTARLIAECGAPRESKQSTILAIIQSGSPGGIPDAWVEIMDEGTLPPLREMVRTQQTQGQFNFTAASMLSKLGDAEIVEDLRAQKAAFEAASPPTPKVRTMAQYLWRIEVQHPPTRLLEYIGSADRCDNCDMRMWAVTRARQLGLGREAIRKAILEHNANAKTRLERSEIPYLKWIGLELGILLDTDLPDVKLSEPKVTP
jgi:hypothetical protein